MLSLARVRRAYHDSGALNALFAPWGFVDESAFLTKAGDVGIAYRVAGVDFECLDAHQRQDVVHRCEAALRLLDESSRLYQYLVKRRLPPLPTPAAVANPIVNEALRQRYAYLRDRREGLFDIQVYFVLLASGLRPRVSTIPSLRQLRHPTRALSAWCSQDTTTRMLDGELDAALRGLYQRASMFEAQLQEIRPTRLGQAETFQLLRRLVNYDEVTDQVDLTADAHLDYFMSDSAVECHPDHLDVGSHHVRVLTMKEPPASTSPLILERLYTLPAPFIACLEWQRIPAASMRRDLRMRRRHAFNRRVSMVNYLSSETRPEEMLVDQSAGAVVQQLGDALTAMDVDGRVFGECSLTIVLHDRDVQRLDHSVAEATKVLTSRDGAVTQERYNLLNAWLGIVPGNYAYNLRRLALLETNLADLSFLFTLQPGQHTCPHLDREALAIFETRHETLFHHAMHVDDVGHAAIVGATGSGKSFLMNFLLMHAQRYDPITAIFDITGSYRKLATLLGGRVITLGLQPDVQINPFSLPPTPDHLHFLAAFVRVLLEANHSTPLSDAQERDVYEGVKNLYVVAAEQRRLFTLRSLLPRVLADRLSKWIEGERFGALFDHAEDTVPFDRFQVFELDAIHDYPEIRDPLLFYVLARFSMAVKSPANIQRLKICLMEEAWAHIEHPALRAYIRELLKTGRSANASIWLATQSIQDFAATDLLRTVLEACSTKFLLANPGFDPEQYRQLFHLNDTELDLVRGLRPRAQCLLKRPTIAKVLTLTVDPRSYALYTNTPADNARLAALIRDHGLSDALDRFATTA